MLKFLGLLAIVCCVQVHSKEASGVTWAVLVAGSNEYYNYRHQADVCHSYQILHKHGIPDERIVVMMFDDIANDPENPTPGKIINKPNGEDVYKGVPKDYTGNTVTPTNFLHVLSGNASAVKGIGSGRVINSGPNDNVFVFFSDHGAPGLIAFPTGDVLAANALNKTLTEMHKNKRYKNMVLYVEACESGSMFENILSKHINIYATTAANSEESSYACYYDDTYQTYLGDLYSVEWMEDSDSENLNKETLLKQFQIVKARTNLSHVMEFGDLSLAKAHNVSEFQGSAMSLEGVVGKTSNERMIKDAVPSEEVRVTILKKRLAKEKNPLVRIQLMEQIKQVNQIHATARAQTKNLATFVLKRNTNNVSVTLKQLLSTRMKLNEHECYFNVIEHMTTVNKGCFDFTNQHFLKSLYLIVNLCEHGVSVNEIKMGVDAVCRQ